MDDVRYIIDRLHAGEVLSLDEYRLLLEECTAADAEYAAELARNVCRSVYGNNVFLRGLVEFSNVCRNDCYYCGIRKGNSNVPRFCLDANQILECCRRGYDAGLRTFVFQGGENPGYDGVLLQVVEQARRDFPDCALTLSIGERDEAVYEEFFRAGANRFLLRHETATEAHYAMLHPAELSWQHRMDCLKMLKRIGYQTGAGFMVGSPWQTKENLAADLMFLNEFKPEMVGIGPFIPHKDTRFAAEPAGSVDLTLFLLSLIRLSLPHVLLPATTALETLDKQGRERGILAGANVIMLNISPSDVDENYNLYNGKPSSTQNVVGAIDNFEKRMKAIDYKVSMSRGDFA